MKFTLQVLLTVLLTASISFAANIEDIIREAKAKGAKYNEEVKTLFVAMDTVKPVTAGQSAKRGLVGKTLLYKKGAKYRIESIIPEIPGFSKSSKNISIYNGKDKWSINPIAGKQKMPAGTLVLGGSNVSFFGEWWNLELSTAKLTGEEKIEGLDCYVIEIVRTKYNSYQIWVGKNNFQLVRDEVARFSPDVAGKQMQSSTRADFKKILGEWEFPSTFYKLQDLYVKDVKVNGEISDEMFDAGKVNVEADDDLQKAILRQGTTVKTPGFPPKPVPHAPEVSLPAPTGDTEETVK